MDVYGISGLRSVLEVRSSGGAGVHPAWNDILPYLRCLESIYSSVSNAFTFTYSIMFYVSNEFTFLWDIWTYVEREFTFLYHIALDFGGKVKYSFRKSAMVNRFFRRERNG